MHHSLATVLFAALVTTVLVTFPGHADLTLHIAGDADDLMDHVRHTLAYLATRAAALR